MSWYSMDSQRCITTDIELYILLLYTPLTVNVVSIDFNGGLTKSDSPCRKVIKTAGIY